MKTSLKRSIVIGAAVLAFGGLLAQGALAAPAPQPVPPSLSTVRSAAPSAPDVIQPAANSQASRNYVNGMINWMQGYFSQGGNRQVTPQEQQDLNQMYGFMRRYPGVVYNMMGSYGGGFRGGMM